ncbi:chromate transporter [Fuchsiella alkaliacetigena]|uniref:chromate transporter n=1 Tax=Fuchsiella alkaliacetigena TaxID=957042 RepID=UPI00200A9997|nr:chromate transporter [Fuchsiella alkaliacetigena]MCK8825767.1 chromate transporter [Fuchsiella alkaliacetigena]
MLLIQLFFTFMKIGVFTFGSGYAMLALAEVEVVNNHHWLTAEQFADAVALAEVTPGPIMVNMATFVGTKVSGVPGALMATLGLIIPPIIALIIIAKLYIDFKDSSVLDKVFAGLRPAVIGLIITVVLKLGRTTFLEMKSVLITVVTVVGIFLGIHPILMVVTSGILGLLIF